MLKFYEAHIRIHPSTNQHDVSNTVANNLLTCIEHLSLKHVVMLATLVWMRETVVSRKTLFASPFLPTQSMKT